MKRFLSWILALALLVSCLPAMPVTVQAATVDSGTCGDNATWVLDDAGTLTISGTGSMVNDYVPWYSYRSNIKTVVIKAGVTSIGSYAFDRCTSLTSITIPNSVTSIGSSAFADCTSLTSVTIPQSVTSIDGYAFSNCNSLATLQVADGNSVYHSAGNCIIETDTKTLIAGCKTSQIPTDGSVTSIDDRAFMNCIGLTSIIIPDSVISISCSAFSGCTGLTSINIPDSVIIIGQGAFFGCTGLTSITIPDSVIIIDHEAFSGCSSLTTLQVAAGNPVYHSAGNCIIETNTKTLIAGCSTSQIPTDGSVTSIGGSAFECYSSLTSITIPESVTNIGDYAFYECSSLTSINIPDSVTSTGERAFCGCTSLTSIAIPDSVTIIGDYAFDGCTNLTSVTIGTGVTSIGLGAFCGCSNLTSVTIPESVTSIGMTAFADCTSLTSVAIPDSVTYIDSYAFYDCSNLKAVFYGGTEAQRADIIIEEYNEYLENATWHYEATDHSWGDWEQTKTPSEKEDGISTRSCSVCGETKTKPIPKNTFTDVKADRFETAILWAYYNGITSGTGDGSTFSPENACTRKQIVTFLWRAAGEPEPKSMVNPFVDVKHDRFEKAILWAYYEGITSGTGDGSTFSPENTCTRKQIATFLWRYHGCPEPASMKNPFTDVKSDRFEKAILWAYCQGITTGTGDGTTFSPENPCTRKQIVTFLYRDLAE